MKLQKHKSMCLLTYYVIWNTNRKRIEKMCTPVCIFVVFFYFVRIVDNTQMQYCACWPTISSIGIYCICIENAYVFFLLLVCLPMSVSVLFECACVCVWMCCYYFVMLCTVLRCTMNMRDRIFVVARSEIKRVEWTNNNTKRSMEWQMTITIKQP